MKSESVCFSPLAIRRELTGAEVFLLLFLLRVLCERRIDSLIGVVSGDGDNTVTTLWFE